MSSYDHVIVSAVVYLWIVSLMTAYFWIGATDLVIEGDWQWMTSHTSVGDHGTYWAPGQPDNANGIDNCMGIRYSDGKWWDGRCDESLHYICERSDSAAIVG